MGFEIPSSIIKLEFDKYPGLEVTAESLTLGEIMDLAGQAETLRADAGRTGDADQLLNAFITRLRSWNCERGGVPVECSRDGYLSMPASFAAEILLAWYDAVSGEDIDKGPLDRRSMNGAPSAAAPFVPTELR